MDARSITLHVALIAASSVHAHLCLCLSMTEDPAPRARGGANSSCCGLGLPMLRIRKTDSQGLRNVPGGTAGKGGNATDSGVTGLKTLGVRELTYKLCFMACSTSVRPPRPCRHPKACCTGLHSNTMTIVCTVMSAAGHECKSVCPCSP